MHEPKKTFVTTDMTLASVLDCNYCLFVGYEQRFGTGKWEFEQTEELEGLVEDFKMERVTVNIHRYKAAENRLRRMIVRPTNS